MWCVVYVVFTCLCVYGVYAVCARLCARVCVCVREDVFVCVSLSLSEYLWGVRVCCVFVCLHECVCVCVAVWCVHVYLCVF